MHLRTRARGVRTSPTEPATTPGVAATVPPAPEAPLAEDDRDLVAADLLVEDVSIDGMCGVY
jgi:mycofactocin precursor